MTTVRLDHKDPSRTGYVTSYNSPKRPEVGELRSSYGDGVGFYRGLERTTGVPPVSVEDRTRPVVAHHPLPSVVRVSLAGKGQEQRRTSQSCRNPCTRESQ